MLLYHWEWRGQHWLGEILTSHILPPTWPCHLETSVEISGADADGCPLQSQLVSGLYPCSRQGPFLPQDPA